MSNKSPAPDPWEVFLSSEQRHRSTLDPLVEEFRATASQYGIMIFRQLALLNGGALVAIAPIANMLQNPNVSVFGCAAGWFVAGLVAVMVASYSAHLNFSLLAGSLEDTRNKRVNEAYKVIVCGEEPNENEDDQEKFKRSIWISFWASHLFGWVSVLAFCLGAFTLIGAAQ